MEGTGFSILLKGLIVGGTMIIPGVSGGTMAMILGIYDRLIHAISSFRESPLENTRLLIKFAIGGILGLLLFSTPVSWLLKNHETQVLYFFIGIIFGGIPLIEQKSGIQKFSVKNMFYILIGTIIVLMISAIPKGVFAINGNVISLLITGSIASIALILPGISVSHLFLILGMYEEILHAIKKIQIVTLLPLAAGVGLGIVLFSKVLENLMTIYPKQTYLVILGFILGSVAGIFPGFPTGAGKGLEFIVSIGLFVGGFFIIYTIQNKYEK